jgi:hypothetical protein
MLKALYLKNKTWLGSKNANAEDLAAIMEDHYQFMEEVRHSPIKKE